MSIASELLLDWLQFEGGRICGVQWHYDKEVLEFLIEHPDMPPNEDGKPYPEICPAYRRIELLGYRVERLK